MNDAVGNAGFISRSHGAIAPFRLVRATSMAEAAEAMAAGAMAHAGGIDLVERLQAGEPATDVVDLGGIATLGRIEVVGDRLHVGAAVSHHRLETDPVVVEHRPDLAAAWHTVGNVRIRRVGTIGGNLMAFDPTYDAAPILAAAGADLVFQSTEGEITSSVAERPPNLLLTRIELPLDGRLRFDRSLKPVVTVAVDRSIAVGCAHPEVQVHDLIDAPADELAALVAQNVPEPIDDSEASATYRRRMIEVLVRRLLELDR